MRVIYEEACLRQERGEEVAPDEYARRFPRWADELAVLLDCHGLMLSRLSHAASMMVCSGSLSMLRVF